jgi:hypothetical protein
VVPACAHFLVRRVDQALDFLGRCGRTLGQVAHFGCHDCEAATLFPGARCFDGRIQCQDIGLERDAIDDARDVRNLARGDRDRIHAGDHLRDGVAAFLGHA